MHEIDQIDKEKTEYFEALHNALTEQFGLKAGSEEYYMGAAGFKTNLDPESALDDVNKAIDLSPNNASYHLIKGKLLIKLGRCLEAAEEFHQATKLEAHFALAWAYYGFALTLDMRNDQELEILNVGTILMSYATALQYNPKCAEAYHFRAITYYGLLNDIPRFIKNANKAIKIYKMSKDYDSLGSEENSGVYELTQMKTGLKLQYNIRYLFSWLLSFLCDPIG